MISFFFVIFPYFRYSLYLKFSFLAAIISLIVLCLYNIGKIVGFGYFGYYSFTFPVFFISVGISRHILRDWNWPAPQAEDQKRGASWKNKWSFIQSKHHKYIRKIQSYVNCIQKTGLWAGSDEWDGPWTSIADDWCSMRTTLMLCTLIMDPQTKTGGSRTRS